MKTTLIIFWCVMLVGCGEDLVSSPVPQPVPSCIRQSTPEGAQVTTLVVGLPSAVAGAGKVHLRDRLTGTSVVTTASASGSFAGVVPAVNPDLEARYENKDGLSEPVALSTRSYGVHPTLLPALNNGMPVSGPDGNGDVTVTNDDGVGKPLLFDATPNIDVVVSNSSNGAVASTVTDKDGRLKTKLAGASKDTINVLLVDPTNTTLTSDFLSFTVP